MLTVVDLNAGIGGRAHAFIEHGFEVKEVYEMDAENAFFLSQFIDEKNVHNINLNEVDPVKIQKADIYAFKYLQQQPFFESWKECNDS